MEQQLIKLLMHKEFFDANKTRVMRSMFPNELTDLYDTIVNGHENYERDLSSQEVREIYRVSNPTATRAKREAVAEVLTDIEHLPTIGSDVATDVLNKMWQQEIGRNIDYHSAKNGYRHRYHYIASLACGCEYGK